MKRQDLERAASILDSIGDAVFAVDEDLSITFFNGAAEKVLGLGRDEMLGRPLIESFPETMASELEQRCRQASAHRRPDSFELEVESGPAADWYAVRIHPHGRGLLVFLHVITERKLAEEALRASEARYRLLADNTVDCIWRMNLDAVFEYINPASVAMLGYTPDEMIGTPLSDYCDEANFEKMYREIAAALSDPGVFERTHAAEFIRRDGTVLDAEISGRLLRDDDGAPVALQGVTRDVTERHAAEAALRRSEEMLRRSQRMESIGRLAGGIAHDFNNLLTVVNTNAELIVDKLSPDHPMWNAVFEIRAAGERAAHLTSQLLAFSRRQIVDPQVLDLSAILGEMQALLGGIVTENVELRLDLAPDLGPVKVDHAQIEQAVINLVVNARDAMPSGGKLTLGASNVSVEGSELDSEPEAAPGRYVMLSVRDTGCGMDEATLASAFEPFFTTKDPGHGTGLGLSTVHGIVEQSGGHVRLDSEPGRGTTVEIYLPRADEPPRRPARSAARGDLKGAETILVVEDEQAVRSVMTRILAAAGYTVIAAGSGEEALEVYRDRADTIDLVITDVVMPGMSGRDLADRLATDAPDLKILFMSGYTEDAIVHHGVIDQGIRFISKPFTIKDLLATIRSVIDGD